MFIDQIKFAFRKYPIRMWVVIIIAILAFVFSTYEKWVHDHFQWTDPVLGVLTFIISMLVFFNQVRLDWERNLQSRISVNFEYNGNVAMRFQNGLIPDGTDIRAWAQQIGAQMGKSRALEFEPSIQMNNNRIHYDSKMQCYYKLYAVTFILTQLPDFSAYRFDSGQITDEKQRSAEEQIRRNRWIEFLKNGGCIDWYATFDDDNKIRINRSPKDL